MWEENNIGGYTQNNEEPTGPLESLSNLNQKAGQALLNLGGQALQKYDEIEQGVLPMRRPAIHGTADWVDNNLTSLLKRFKLTEPYAEKAGDIAGVTTDVGLEIFSPGLEETAAATLTAGAALSPLPVIDEGLGALATGGLYGKNVFKRAAKELPNYQRILNGVFDGSWKRVDGERVFVTPEGVRIDANNIDLNPNIMQSKGVDDADNLVPKGSADQTGRGSSKYYNSEYGDVLANADPKNVELLKKIGLNDNQAVFVLSNYDKIDRDTAAAIENLGISVTEFNNTKKIALPYLLEAWSNIKRTKTPQLDHINQLKSALPFFNNAPVEDFPGIAKIILEEGVFGGHSRKNFKYLEFDVHSVKSAFWNRRVGRSGEKFFKGRDISTPEKLRAAARDYAKEIVESNKVVDNAIIQYKLMNKTDISQEELFEFVNLLGSSRIDPKNMVKQVRAILKEIEADDIANTAKATQRVETDLIKQEARDLKTATKKSEALARDDASVQRTAAKINKFISTRINKFKGAYPLGMKDEQLHTDAVNIVRSIKNNRALREDIQGTVFDVQDEAAQIEAMKRILFDRSRRAGK